MTLKNLLDTIGVIGINDRLINFAGAGGSVYEINDLTIRDYPILYVSPTGTHRTDQNTTTYQLTIFYIDRLLEDSSNSLDIHSAGVEVLKNIIRKIEDTEGIVSVSDEYTITLFTETEKMKDRCNGAYATLEITVLNGYVCADFEDGTDIPNSAATWYFKFNNEQNAHMDSAATEYTVSWSSNIERFKYSFMGSMKEWHGHDYITGYTTERSIKFTYDLNTTDREKPQSLYIVFNDPDNPGEEIWNNYNWIQDQYWWLEWRDYSGGTADVTSATTQFELSWNSNNDSGYDYEVLLNGETIQTGFTAQPRITAEFGSNTSEPRKITVLVTMHGKNVSPFEFTINQAEGTLYFNYITEDNQTVPFNQSVFTVEWDTNYDMSDIMYLFGISGYGYTETGYTSGSSLTFNLSENTGDTAIPYYFTFVNISGMLNMYQARYPFEFTGGGNEMNSFVSSADTAYTITFRSDWPATQWHMTDSGSNELASGTTTGTSVEITYPANSSTTDQAVYHVDFVSADEPVFSEPTSGYGTFTLTQAAAFIPHITIVSGGSEEFDCSGGTWDIQFETNFDSVFAEYILPDGTSRSYTLTGGTLSVDVPSGVSGDHFVRFYDTSGGTIYALATAHENEVPPVAPYFNLISPQTGTTIPATQTSLTIEWETNTVFDFAYVVYPDSGFTMLDPTEISMTGITFNFSENTDLNRRDIYLFLQSPAVNNNFKWQQAGTEELINGDIRSDFNVGEPVRDIDNMVPYGYYVFRWTAQGDKFAKLTPPYDPYYVTERDRFSFIDASVDNGVLSVQDAQKLRIVQAIPMADVASLSGETIYVSRIPSYGYDVYTGATYLLYDIYNNLYYHYDFFSSEVQISNDTGRALVLCNCLNGSEDGNKVGGRHVNQIDSQAYIPACDYSAVSEQYSLNLRRQISGQPRPYEYNTSAAWEAAKVDIIPITEIE